MTDAPAPPDNHHVEGADDAGARPPRICAGKGVAIVVNAMSVDATDTIAIEQRTAKGRTDGRGARDVRQHVPSVDLACGSLIAPGKLAAVSKPR